MASAVDSRLAYARLSAVATASRLPTANRGSNNSYTTSWDTTAGHLIDIADQIAARRHRDRAQCPAAVRVRCYREAFVVAVGVEIAGRAEDHGPRQDGRIQLCFRT